MFDLATTADAGSSAGEVGSSDTGGSGAAAASSGAAAGKAGPGQAGGTGTELSPRLGVLA